MQLSLVPRSDISFLQKDARQKDRDFMWYLWCGRKSPLSGRNIKTFERTYVLDENTWFEQSNPYYKFYHEEKVCIMILHEFGLYSESSHIINDKQFPIGPYRMFSL